MSAPGSAVAWTRFARWLERAFPLSVKSAFAGPIAPRSSVGWLIVVLR